LTLHISKSGWRDALALSVARKHAGGNGADGFTISMPTLYEKSGSESPYRRFKFEMLKLARENGLPGYSLEIVEQAGKEPSIKMVRRGALTYSSGEEEVLPPPSSAPLKRRLRVAKAGPSFRPMVISAIPLLVRLPGRHFLTPSETSG
jgi:hypothetical protein